MKAIIEFFEYYWGELLCGLLAVALMGLVIMGLISLTADEHEKEKLIGSKIIINNDTLIITDYNSWKENYNLSNGSVIDEDYAKEQLK